MKKSKKKASVKPKKAQKSGNKVKAPVKTNKAKPGVVPAGDRVLVRRMQPEDTTSFGMIIPDTTKEKSEEGIVVAIGPGKKNADGKIIPVSFEVGQRVRFSYGDEIKINGIEHVLVLEDNITAIINN